MKRPVLVLGIGLAVLGLCGGIAYATIPGPDGVIHACFTKSGGTLRVIDAGTGSCSSKEQSVNWNAQGPSGPQGPTGPQGPAGEQGPPGAPATAIWAAFGADGALVSGSGVVGASGSNGSYVVVLDREVAECAPVVSVGGSVFSDAHGFASSATEPVGHPTWVFVDTFGRNGDGTWSQQGEPFNLAVFCEPG